MSIFDNMKIDHNTKLSFEQMAEKYRQFYAPNFTIDIEGKKSLAIGMEIPEVNFINPMDGADQFLFTVNNAFDLVKKDFLWIDEYLSPGKSVEINMGYGDRLEPMLYGRIREVKYSFPSSGYPRLEVSGLDISQSMMQGKNSESWKEVRDSDVIKKIAQKYKIPQMEISDTKVKHHKIEKEKKSDFDFIRELAERNNYQFFIFGKTLYFKEKSPPKAPVVLLEWGKNLMRFQADVSIAGQPSKVRRVGWDPVKKQKIIGEATAVDEIGKGGKKTSADLIREIFGREVVEEIHCHVNSPEEARHLAQADLNQRSAKLLIGSGESIGIPEIRAGRHLELAGLGSKFSKTYDIFSTTHTISSTGYFTNFNVRSNKL